MRTVRILIALLMTLTMTYVATSQPASADSEDSWDKLSTALVFGLAGGAELETLTRGDRTGQSEFFLTMAATLALSEGLKAVIHEPRPDGSSDDSFPSAHTALAFAAASYFDIRYGDENKTLVPFLYGAAALTAVGRVEAKKHFVGDVAAGALIGIAVAHAFTTTQEGVAVFSTGDGVGFNYVKHF